MFTDQEEARVRYLPNHYEILSYGDYVLCAVTAEKIPLSQLTYWNVERQEAYKDAQTAFERETALNNELGFPKDHWL